eukprot:scaffold6594_cov162-Amphora_coffeaeformis.AAC.2
MEPQETEGHGMPMVSSEESLYVDIELPSESTYQSNRPTDNRLSLRDCGQWLLSIPDVQARALQSKREYRDLIRSLHNLERAHARLLHTSLAPPCFLQQHETADEILHFILNFLEAQSLGRLACSCTRFRGLVSLHAARRAHRMLQEERHHEETRQLSHPLQLVRATEQLQGIFPHHPYVRIPSLLLSRPVVLREAGDPDFNGIYFCTGSNGNGFVFTKPRTSVPALVEPAMRTSAQDVDLVDPTSMRREEPAGYRLKCIISKRFSNETLLWYCCKEILVTSTPNFDGDIDEDYPETTARAEVPNVMIAQRYAFWTRLSMLGDASDYDLFRYPSPTSILLRQGGVGWQSLSNSRHIQPPIVELID